MKFIGIKRVMVAIGLVCLASIFTVKDAYAEEFTQVIIEESEYNDIYVSRGNCIIDILDIDYVGVVTRTRRVEITDAKVWLIEEYIGTEGIVSRYTYVISSADIPIETEEKNNASGSGFGFDSTEKSEVEEEDVKSSTEEKEEKESDNAGSGDNAIGSNEKSEGKKGNNAGVGHNVSGSNEKSEEKKENNKESSGSGFDSTEKSEVEDKDVKSPTEELEAGVKDGSIMSDGSAGSDSNEKSNEEEIKELIDGPSIEDSIEYEDRNDPFEEQEDENIKEPIEEQKEEKDEVIKEPTKGENVVIVVEKKKPVKEQKEEKDEAIKEPTENKKEEAEEIKEPIEDKKEEAEAIKEPAEDKKVEDDNKVIVPRYEYIPEPKHEKDIIENEEKEVIKSVTNKFIVVEDKVVPLESTPQTSDLSNIGCFMYIMMGALFLVGVCVRQIENQKKMERARVRIKKAEKDSWN